MIDKFTQRRAKKIIGKYGSYTSFSKNASKSEKKAVIKSTALKANKLQRNVTATSR